MDPKLSAAAAAFLALAFLLSGPNPSPASGEARNANEAITLALRPDTAQAQTVIDAHCVVCHAAQPQMNGLAHAAGGLDFSKAGNSFAHRDAIRRVAVFSRAMPPPGAAQPLSPDEKLLLARWAESVD